MRNCFLAVIFLLVCSSASAAAEDYVKVRYNPGYSETGAMMEVMLEDNFFGKEHVVSGVYEKLKELQTSGRLEFAWPDAPLITIEVHYKGEVIASSISPKLSNESKEFADFSRLWNEAYAIVWQDIEAKLKP